MEWKDRSQFWGKRFGSYSSTQPKNAPYVWGNVFSVPRGSAQARAGGAHSGATGRKLRWYPGRKIKVGKTH